MFVTFSRFKYSPKMVMFKVKTIVINLCLLNLSCVNTTNRFDSLSLFYINFKYVYQFINHVLLLSNFETQS